jgi:hypothetical protein
MKYLYVFCLLISFLSGFSQVNKFKSQLHFEGNLHYGFVTPHHDYIAYFVNDHIRGFQLNVGINTDGSKQWHHSFNFPKVGMGYYNSGLGNREIYGNVNALFFYIDRAYLNVDNRFNFGNRICFGIGNVSKTFDLIDNPFNSAIGTHYNVFIQYSLEASYRISPRNIMKFGIGMSHTSNGSFYKPNAGINFITSYIGVQQSITDYRELINRARPENADSSKNQFYISGAFGRKAITRLEHKNFPVYAFTLEYSRKVSRSGWLGLALTGYLDESIQKGIALEYPEVITSTSDNQLIVMNLSYEIKMGKLSFMFQPGAYIKTNYKYTGAVCNKLALRYAFHKRAVAGVAIKSHWVAIADFVEWSIGYQFKK